MSPCSSNGVVKASFRRSGCTWPELKRPPSSGFATILHDSQPQPASFDYNVVAPRSPSALEFKMVDMIMMELKMVQVASIANNAVS